MRKLISCEKRCDSDDRYLVVTVFLQRHVLYNDVTFLLTATTNILCNSFFKVIKIPFFSQKLRPFSALFFKNPVMPLQSPRIMKGLRQSVHLAYGATTSSTVQTASFNIEADKRVCKASRPRIEKEQSKKQTHKQEHCLPNYKSWTILKHNPTNLKQDKAILRSLSTLSCPILPIYRYLCYIIP